MDINKMKGLLHDDAAKTKVTLKEGDQSITVERTPSENTMTVNGLLGGMVGGISPTPVADDKTINVTSGEFVVNKPAADKYAGLLEDINNEGREMLARGGYAGKSPMQGYAAGGKLSEKVSKIYKEGYTAPGQAFAIAKSMGYQQGGEVTWTGNPVEDAKMIVNHKLFKRLVDESKQFGYDPAELPGMLLENQYLGKLFDTPEKQEALLLANAQAQSVPSYKYGGKVNYQTGGEVSDDVLAQSGQSRYHYNIYGPTEATKKILNQMSAAKVGGGYPNPNKDKLLTQPNPVRVDHEEDVTKIAADKPLTTSSESETETKDASQDTGVLDNRSFDFILEKSRGLAAGKGFGGAKLGAREYVDELYKPVETASDKGGSGSKRVFNLEWRDPTTGQVEVRAGRRNAEGEFELQDENGNWVPAFQVTGTTDIRVAPRSADPGVEKGAGGIPNASSYNEITKVPTFEFARESEAKAYGYVVRAIGADQQLTKLESEISPEKISSLYGGLAQWAARNANAKITAAVLNNYLQEAGLQRYSREMTKFLQAVLRTDTGAAYTGTEIADYLSAFGISPGTQITPEILQGFQLGRKQEIGAQIGRTGKAGAYLNGLLAGKYPIPYSSVIGGSVNAAGNSGQTSSGVNWKIK